MVERGLPQIFGSQKALRWLSSFGMAGALASLAGSIIGAPFTREASHASVAVALTTLVFALIWSRLLYLPKAPGDRSIRVGWFLSIPLAALNAALSCMFIFESHKGIDVNFMVAVAGATFGAIIWVPALIGTLLVFGLPIARAQKLAEQGLSGEERGTQFASGVSLAMSLVGLLFALVDPVSRLIIRLQPYLPTLHWTHLVVAAVALLGAVTSATSLALSSARKKRRAAFVQDALAGKVEGFRVDATAEGQVLVRINQQGQGYRVADFEEPVLELDAQGQAKRLLSR
jgi:hypothetical protein